MAGSGNLVEDQRVAELSRALSGDFEIYREVTARHCLLPINLRIDLLAIPRDETFSAVALGLEVKGHPDWLAPELAKCLKQASDYVLSVVCASPDLPSHHVGKRVMAVFIYPPPPRHHYESTATDSFLAGMAQMAAYHRVGTASVDHKGRTVLACPEPVWVQNKGWRATAIHILAGKRQVGSQRFNILDLLSKIQG